MSSRLRELTVTVSNALRDKDSTAAKVEYLPFPKDDETASADSMQTEAEEAYYAQQRREMDDVAAHIFPPIE